MTPPLAFYGVQERCRSTLIVIVMVKAAALEVVGLEEHPKHCTLGRH